MCNIAGYVGKKNATEILINMVKDQEGLYSGFYSGLAVHDGQSISLRKIRGDFDALLRETDAASLKGNLGIIHSRTPFGGDNKWAHPFFTEIDGDIKMCYVANGEYGRYIGDKAQFNSIADDLVVQGLDFPCKLEKGNDDYNRLSSGEYIHISDIMCQLIYKYKLDGFDTPEAMRKAFTKMPSEIVGLVICKEHPDKIFYSRINKPMFVGFDDDGAYLVSSPLGFPETVKEFKLLPALSSGVVYSDRCDVIHYPEFYHSAHGFNHKTVLKACKMIMEMLESGERETIDMMHSFKNYLPKDKLGQEDPIIYIALYELLKSGRINMNRRIVNVDGQDGPKVFFSKA